MGDYLIKCNKDNNGRQRKFFSLEPGYLKYALKAASIGKSTSANSNIFFYNFSILKKYFFL